MTTMTGDVPRLVLDTNVWVAAAFRPSGSAGTVVARIRRGELRLVWDDATRGETEAVVRRIPPLSWDRVAPLFRAEDRFAGRVDVAPFDAVPDPADRRFAALAAAADATLLTSDHHLLDGRDSSAARILTPREFVRGGDDGAGPESAEDIDGIDGLSPT